MEEDGLGTVTAACGLRVNFDEGPVSGRAGPPFAKLGERQVGASAGDSGRPARSLNRRLAGAAHSGIEGGSGGKPRGWGGRA